MKKINPKLNKRKNSKLLQGFKVNEKILSESKKKIVINKLDAKADISSTDNIDSKLLTKVGLSERDHLPSKVKEEKLNFCNYCNKIDTSKSFLDCYACRTSVCKDCAIKTSSAKKKEHSNFICTECIGSDSHKKRLVSTYE